MNCFTLSRLTIFPDVPLIQPEVSLDCLNPLFKTVSYSMSGVSKPVNDPPSLNVQVLNVQFDRLNVSPSTNGR